MYPQRIVLVLLLFSLNINDLCTAIDSNVTMIQYADALQVFTSNKDDKIAKTIQESNKVSGHKTEHCTTF